MRMFLPMLMALANDASGGDAAPPAAAPPAPVGPSDDEIRAIFSPPYMYDNGLLDDAIIQENVDRAKKDIHFLNVSSRLRALLDRIFPLKRNERGGIPEQDVLDQSLFKMVLMDGPANADGMVAYQVKKAAAATGVEALPDYQKLVMERAAASIYGAFMAHIDADLKPGSAERAEVEKLSKGLPATIVDHATFFTLCERFQMIYSVADGKHGIPAEEFTWVHDPTRKVSISFGVQNNIWREKPKAKADKAAAPAAPAPAAKVDAAPAPPTQAPPPPES